MKATGIEPPEITSTLWPHTGIVAPYLLTAHDIEYLETGRGVAFTASLRHPELGLIGTVENRGDGGQTWFEPRDRDVFSSRDLAEFSARCRQDGSPWHEASAVESLLAAVLDETEVEWFAAWMRAHSGYLVRTYEPRTETNYGPHHGQPQRYLSIAWGPATRAALVEQLNADARTRADDGAYWTMFNGQMWTPLLPEREASPQQFGDRMEEMAAVSEAARSESATALIQSAGPLADGLYVTSASTESGWLLIGDPGPGRTDAWCCCHDAERPAVRFEKWDIRGLNGTGTLHAKETCRRLLVID